MPLLPIPMKPAYRYGVDTPWGGDMLATVLGKHIPDKRTGECLEVSTLPGLNSTDENGLTLTDLICRFGVRITGTRIGESFPLLLKLVDARDRLSVQVHPNDDIAQKFEGKSGKSEAWVILAAEPDASILYGLKENTTQEQLRDMAMRGGAEIEKYLQTIPVRPSDVIDIPAGTIHAIGAGITLYELQQASDVTYRLYDWQRVDEYGKARPLHTEKALASVDASSVFHPAEPVLLSCGVSGTRTRLLTNKYFTIERWVGCSEEQLAPDPERFRIITSLGKTVLRMKTGGKEIMRTGRAESLLLPADGFPMYITSEDLLLAYPAFP